MSLIVTKICVSLIREFKTELEKIYNMFLWKYYIKNRPKAAMLYCGYHLGLHNYFSSPKLFEDLSQKHTTATGTERVKKKGLPKEVVRAKLEQHQVSEKKKWLHPHHYNKVIGVSI